MRTILLGFILAVSISGCKTTTEAKFSSSKENAANSTDDGSDMVLPNSGLIIIL